jgi:hypothetical protein
LASGASTSHRRPGGGAGALLVLKKTHACSKLVVNFAFSFFRFGFVPERPGGKTKAPMKNAKRMEKNLQPERT